MWFRLAGANWSGDGNSLGSMSSISGSWTVQCTTSGGISKTTGASFVTQGGTWTGTFTLATGAEFTSATLTPSTAGTVTSTPSGSTVTITIANVSANCTLSVVATGGSGGGDTPVNPPSGTVDTWYTNYAIGPAKDGANIAKADFAGFAYQGANDDNYIGVPINAVRLRVAQAGTMTIGIVNKSDLKTIVSSQTITLANPSVSNVQEYRLPTQITLTSGQLLLFGAQKDTGLFYYKENGTATPANGECMYHHLGTSGARRGSSSASLTVDAGFLI